MDSAIGHLGVGGGVLIRLFASSQKNKRKEGRRSHFFVLYGTSNESFNERPFCWHLVGGLFFSDSNCVPVHRSQRCLFLGSIGVQ